VTEQPGNAAHDRERTHAHDDLARRRGEWRPVTDVSELRCDIWESDEELDAFLADLRASRKSGLV